ncbi:hypothetical protein JTE90_028201 [Oedothorax gibbosus]|uniref:Uncharacterized protein n=1 Tax=Oedothorax gibbosus TaxID=931172 RepID=A0AAV6TLT4_9ARAC|nr:hypothetical protein JTE90_028201 [Oedothorax gibbosus]
MSINSAIGKTTTMSMWCTSELSCQVDGRRCPLLSTPWLSACFVHLLAVAKTVGWGGRRLRKDSAGGRCFCWLRMLTEGPGRNWRGCRNLASTLRIQKTFY